jgi:hypothetical protein
MRECDYQCRTANNFFQGADPKNFSREGRTLSSPSMGGGVNFLEAYGVPKARRAVFNSNFITVEVQAFVESRGKVFHDLRLEPSR